MALTVGVKEELVKKTKKSIARARDLHQRICIYGATQNDEGFSRLLNVDKRDAAMYIFFEVAAQYEHFCCEAFKIEVRKKFNVPPSKAEIIMGSVDRGLRGTMGWAKPSNLQDRAKKLFGKTGFFGRFDTIMPPETRNWLIYAHKVRNRIAHNGKQATSAYSAILVQLGVPFGSRKGSSVGRVLLEYPNGTDIDDRWFDRFLRAYGTVVTEFDKRVRI